MKAILMSIKPEWVAKILNGEKTIEIRKKFPSDYVGWVYIYCTKENDLFKSYIRMGYYTTRSTADNLEYNGKGKIVARFWCDKTEEINKITMYNRPYNLFETKTLQPSELLKQSCLRATEMTKYFMFSNLPKESAAIHITKLEIFDSPKEISEFENRTLTKPRNINPCVLANGYFVRPLTRAPQSWCFVEI